MAASPESSMLMQNLALASAAPALTAKPLRVVQLSLQLSLHAVTHCAVVTAVVTADSPM